MLKAVVALRREDGSFPDVGMSDRTVVSGMTVKGIRQQALDFAGQRSCRIEYHNGSLLLPPFLLETW